MRDSALDTAAKYDISADFIDWTYHKRIFGVVVLQDGSLNYADIAGGGSESRGQRRKLALAAGLEKHQQIVDRGRPCKS